MSAALLMSLPLTAIGMNDVLTIKLFGVGMVPGLKLQLGLDSSGVDQAGEGPCPACA
ncbi:hypothetical protein [Streptomyces sp. NPDC020298]|uniref:hypothetical protein n=1 Tax=unclassified Streptomyces TaxID=2593676 RepID=UPI0033D58FB6